MLTDDGHDRLVRIVTRAHVIGALCVALCVLLTGCGTTGSTFLKGAPDASYILITEGEMQGSITNSEIKGCKVTLGGALSTADFPFDEFSYSADGCTLRARASDQGIAQ